MALLLGPLLVCLPACKEQTHPAPASPTPPPNAIARIGDEFIVIDELIKRTTARTEEGINRELDQLIEERTILARAKAEGFTGRPEIQDAIDRLIVAAYRDHHIGENAGEISNEDLRVYYSEHIDEFTKPAARRFGVIKIASNNQAAVESLPKIRTADESGFAQFVTRFSEDQSTRYRGGDAGWFSKNDPHPRWPQEVMAAAWSLEEIGVSSPTIEVGEFSYVVRLLAMENAKTNSFDSVRDVIRHQLAGQTKQTAKEEFSAQLKQGADVEIYEEKLSELAETSQQDRPAPPKAPGT